MVEPPPEYLHPAPSERGETFALTFSDYRALCCHGLALLHSSADSVMAIRKQGQAACVDLWLDQRCVTIEVNSQEEPLNCSPFKSIHLRHQVCSLPVALPKPTGSN
jgi:hypothetical protein